MATFNPKSFEKKLKSLDPTQTAIQTLSLWILHHRHHAEQITNTWLDHISKTIKPDKKLGLFYLVNDVVQNGRRKAKDLVTAFGGVLLQALPLLRDPRIKNQIERVFDIWLERNVYDIELINTFRQKIEPSPQKVKIEKKVIKEKIVATTPKRKTVPANFKVSSLLVSIKKATNYDNEVERKSNALEKLKIDASSFDSVKHVKDRSSVGRFHKQFEESKILLEDYIQTLRRCQRDKIVLMALLSGSEVFYEVAQEEAKVIVNAYKTFGNRLNSMKKKLDGKIKRMEEEEEAVASSASQTEGKEGEDAGQSAAEENEEGKNMLKFPTSPALMENSNIQDMDLDSDSDNDMVTSSPRYNPMSVPLLDASENMYPSASPPSQSSSDLEDQYRKFQSMSTLDDPIVQPNEQQNHLVSTSDSSMMEKGETQLFQPELPMPPAESPFNFPQQRPQQLSESTSSDQAHNHDPLGNRMPMPGLLTEAEQMHAPGLIQNIKVEETGQPMPGPLPPMMLGESFTRPRFPLVEQQPHIFGENIPQQLRQQQRLQQLEQQQQIQQRLAQEQQQQLQLQEQKQQEHHQQPLTPPPQQPLTPPQHLPRPAFEVSPPPPGYGLSPHRQQTQSPPHPLSLDIQPYYNDLSGMYDHLPPIHLPPTIGDGSTVPSSCEGDGSMDLQPATPVERCLSLDTTTPDGLVIAEEGDAGTSADGSSKGFQLVKSPMDQNQASNPGSAASSNLPTPVQDETGKQNSEKQKLIEIQKKQAPLQSLIDSLFPVLSKSLQTIKEKQEKQQELHEGDPSVSEAMAYALGSPTTPDDVPRKKGRFVASMAPVSPATSPLSLTNPKGLSENQTELISIAAGLTKFDENFLPVSQQDTKLDENLVPVSTAPATEGDGSNSPPLEDLAISQAPVVSEEDEPDEYPLIENIIPLEKEKESEEPEKKEKDRKSRHSSSRHRSSHKDEERRKQSSSPSRRSSHREEDRHKKSSSRSPSRRNSHRSSRDSRDERHSERRKYRRSQSPRRRKSNRGRRSTSREREDTKRRRSPESSRAPVYYNDRRSPTPEMDGSSRPPQPQFPRNVMSTPIVNSMLQTPPFQIPSPSISVIANQTLSMDEGQAQGSPNTSRFINSNITLNSTGVYQSTDDSILAVTSSTLTSNILPVTANTTKSDDTVNSRILQIADQLRPITMPVNHQSSLDGMVPPILNFDGTGRPMILPGLQLRNSNPIQVLHQRGDQIVHIRANSGFIPANQTQNILAGGIGAQLLLQQQQPQQQQQHPQQQSQLQPQLPPPPPQQQQQQQNGMALEAKNMAQTASRNEIVSCTANIPISSTENPIQKLSRLGQLEEAEQFKRDSHSSDFEPPSMHGNPPERPPLHRPLFGGSLALPTPRADASRQLPPRVMLGPPMNANIEQPKPARFERPPEPRMDGPRPDLPNGPQLDAPRPPPFDAPGPPRADALRPRGQRFDGPRGPRFDGPRGPRFDGPRGPRFDGPRGPRFDGPRGPRFDGPRGPRFDEPGRRFDGPRGPRFEGPRSARFDGPKDFHGPRFDGPRPPRPPHFDGPRPPLFMVHPDADRPMDINRNNDDFFESRRRPKCAEPDPLLDQLEAQQKLEQSMQNRDQAQTPEPAEDMRMSPPRHERPPIDEPPRPKFCEPPGPEYNEPPNFDEPPLPEFDEPPRPNFDEPPRPNFDEPPRAIFNGPPRPNFNGPPRPNFRGPPRPNFRGPPRPNFNGPPRPNFKPAFSDVRPFDEPRFRPRHFRPRFNAGPRGIRFRPRGGFERGRFRPPRPTRP